MPQYPSRIHNEYNYLNLDFQSAVLNSTKLISGTRIINREDCSPPSTQESVQIMFKNTWPAKNVDVKNETCFRMLFVRIIAKL